VRQPWIFAQALAAKGGGNIISLRSPTEGRLALSPQGSFVPNLEETGLRFLELLSCHQPPEFHISRAKRFFNFFCDNLKWGNYVKKLLNREETLSGMEKVWKEYFRENGE
jgi:hypothetical protein